MIEWFGVWGKREGRDKGWCEWWGGRTSCGSSAPCDVEGDDGVVPRLRLLLLLLLAEQALLLLLLRLREMRGGKWRVETVVGADAELDQTGRRPAHRPDPVADLAVRARARPPVARAGAAQTAHRSDCHIAHFRPPRRRRPAPVGILHRRAEVVAVLVVVGGVRIVEAVGGGRQARRRRAVGVVVHHVVDQRRRPPHHPRRALRAVVVVPGVPAARVGIPRRALGGGGDVARPASLACPGRSRPRSSPSASCRRGPVAHARRPPHILPQVLLRLLALPSSAAHAADARDHAQAQRRRNAAKPPIASTMVLYASVMPPPIPLRKPRISSAAAASAARTASPRRGRCRP